MEPANTIIDRLGGPSAVAAHLGLHRVTVSKWKQGAGGTGGMIPFERAPALIGLARVRGIDLSADDFLPPQPSGDAA